MNALQTSESPVCAGLIAEQNDGTDAIVGAAGAERKRLAGLRAVLALHGSYLVHELSDGGYLVVWRGQSRDARDLDEVEAFARRVGAVR